MNVSLISKTSTAALLLALFFCGLACDAASESDQEGVQPASDQPTSTATASKQESSFLTEGLRRLSPTDEVWIDTQRKRVIVGGRICLREGLLEMFACPQGTKEHESIVAVNSKAFVVHTALLAVGGRSGRPVQYDPQYIPASGSIIKVEVAWNDANGKPQVVDAHQMIRNVKTGKAMEGDWVFAGSMFWQEPDSTERYYLAEGGELICVSNFSSAMLDLTVESPQANAELLFEAIPDRIPELETAVRLILTPQPEPTEQKPDTP